MSDEKITQQRFDWKNFCNSEGLKHHKKGDIKQKYEFGCWMLPAGAASVSTAEIEALLRFYVTNQHK